jgi:arylsulfatase A-like enzyme
MKNLRFLSLLLFPMCLASVAVGASTRPNLLLILADDLGYSDLGCYGGEIETPNLDALAKGGVRLTQFYSTGRCCPSRASLLSGQYPHRVGLGHMTINLRRPGYAGRISERAVTIAEALKSSGYRSFISGKWHLGTADPTRHGFEEFFGNLVSAKTFWDPDHFVRLPASRPRKPYDRASFYGTDALTDHALDFLERARETPERPWLLYLSYNAPHFLLHARDEDIAKYKARYQAGWDALRDERLARMKKLGVAPLDTKLTPRSQFWDYGVAEPGVNPAWADLPDARQKDLARRMAIYAAMVDRMDQQIGRVIRDLKARGEFENTLILFLSDNGACAEWHPFGFDLRNNRKFGARPANDLDRMAGQGTFYGVGSGWANASNTPWRLYKHFNHEGGISGPFIAHWPAGIADKGKILREPAHLIDVLPTFVAAAEGRYPKQRNGQETIPLPGRNLLPHLNGRRLGERTLFFEHEGNRAIRRGDWKAVSVASSPWELYRIDVDRTEMTNLASGESERLQDMVGDWTKWGRGLDAIPRPRNYGVNYLGR